MALAILLFVFLIAMVLIVLFTFPTQALVNFFFQDKKKDEPKQP
jgi:hypothetical protein